MTSTPNQYKILLPILLLALIPRLFNLGSNLQIHFDQGLHALGIWQIWHEGRISLLGHQTDTDGIWHGPIFYWLTLPAYWLADGDPAGAAYFQAGLDVIGIICLWYLARDLFDRRTATITALIYAVSYGYASYARWLSNVTPAFPASTLFSYLAFKFFTGNYRMLPLVLFITSIITQHNGAIGAFLYPVVFFLWLFSPHRRGLSLRELVVSFFAFILPHLPLLLFELRHDFVITKSILRFSSSSAGLGLSLMVLHNNVNTLITQMVNLTSYQAAFLTIILLASGLYLLITRNRNVSYRFLLIYIASFFIGLSFYQRGALLFFFVPIFALLTLLFSRAISLMPKSLGIIIFAAVILVNISHWQMFAIPHFNLTPIGTPNLLTNSDRKHVVDWIYHQSAGEPFAVWIYTIPYFLDQPWTYYFLWYGQKHYAYQPEATANFSPGDLSSARYFYAIYEPDENRPFRLATWLQEVDANFGPRVSFYRSNDAFVSKHIISRN